MSEKVSVIIPVHNRENLIQRALNSILQQNILPYELIVVDNASTDNTYDIVKRWMETTADSGIRYKLLRQPQ